MTPGRPLPVAEPGGSRLRRPSPVLLVALGAAAVGLSLGVACRPREVTPTTPAPSPAAITAATPVDVRDGHRSLTAAEAADYLGDQACAACHPEAFRDHVGNRHQQTLRRVTEAEDGPQFSLEQVIRDEERGLAYRTTVREGRCLIQASDGRNSGAAEAHLVLGSGRNAQTFMSEDGPNRFTKLRLTYYTREKKWYFTPSTGPEDQISSPAGVFQDRRMVEECFRCHVTVLQREGEVLDLQVSRLGVGCERCHGPGRPHVERIRQAGKDPEIERLGDASPDRINQVCGDCHHYSGNTNFVLPRTQTNLARFQGIAMEQSECFQQSGTLSCLTCHEPHRDAETSLAYYDATCRSCHGGQQQSVCRVNPRNGCTSCHMPLQEVKGVPMAQYRHHWIRVWDDTGHAGGKRK